MDPLKHQLDVTTIASYESDAQSEVEAFFGEVWKGLPLRFDPEGVHADLRHIPEVYQTNGGGFWLMRREGRIVGTVAVRRLPQNVAEVKRLGVLQRYRSSGVGKELLGHAIRHAVATGYDRVRLDTIRTADPARQLFNKCGFVEIPRYNDNPDATLFMELDLRNAVAGRSFHRRNAGDRAAR